MSDNTLYRLDRLEDEFKELKNGMVSPDVIRSSLKQLNSEISRLDKEFDDLEIAMATKTVQYDNSVARIGSLENTLTWIVRLIIGSVVLSLLGIVLKSGAL